MKKNIKFIGIVMVSAIVGFAVMCVAIAFDASDKVAIASYFIVTVAIAIALGALREDGRKGTRYTSIKDAARYGQAAIFVGTACLFIDTPEVCDELADGLQHHAQKCKVVELTGDETFEIL